MGHYVFVACFYPGVETPYLAITPQMELVQAFWNLGSYFMFQNVNTLPKFCTFTL